MKITHFLAGTLLLTASLLSGCAWAPFSQERAVVHYANALSANAANLDDEAIEELEEAVALDGQFSLAYSMLGDLHRRQGNYEQAAQAYENACELDPWAFNDHLSLGQVYQVLERFTQAIGALKRACQLKPQSPQANYALGVCYYEVADYDQAAVFCGKAAQLDDDNEAIKASLGDIYVKQGQYYDAINAYKQALEIDGDQTEIMVKLGTTYVQMKRFGPAELILKKAIDAQPDKPAPQIAMGFCQLKQGHYQQALAFYQGALGVNDHNEEAYNGVGVAYMLMYLRAKQQTQAAQTALRPQDIEYAKQALAHWHRSLELNSAQPKIRKQVDKYTTEIYPGQ